ncbi:MAG: tetratricopeptide repeat protein [Candidatus Kapabacteria bacterium]|nr:tetratricopeptide repeat protein [Candidatus Kapabacteria bacterium]
MGTSRGMKIIRTVISIVSCALASAGMCGQDILMPTMPSAIIARQSHRYLDQALLQRSLERLRAYGHDWSRTASADQVWIDRSEIDRRRDNRLGASRRLADFTERRAASPLAAGAMLERGFLSLEDGDHAAGAELCRQASEIAARSWERTGDSVYLRIGQMAAFWQATSLAHQGALDEALVAYQKSTVGDDDLAAQSRFAIGQVHEQNGLQAEAFAAYGEVWTNHPRHPLAIAARVRQAVISLGKRQAVRSIDLLNGIDSAIVRLLSSTGSVDTSALDLVPVVRLQALAQAGLFQRSIDTSDAFLRRRPGSAFRWVVHLTAGYAHLHLSRPDSALRHYDAIVTGDADEGSDTRHQALLYRALCLKRLGRSAEAERDFAGLAMQAGYPYKAQALIEVGQAQYERADYERAVKSLEKAEREAQDATTLLRSQILLSSALMHRQQWTRAATVLERAEKIALEAKEELVPLRVRYLADARLHRGICFVQAGAARQAIAALTDFLGNHPAESRRDEATFWLAEAMYKEDMLKNAQELYEEVVRRYTASTRREEAMYGLAWTHFRRRDFDRSAKVFGELLSTYPQSQYATEAMVRRADGLYIAKQFAAAARQYEQASRRDVSSDEGQYAAFQAGQASYRAGELSRALELMRAFVQRYPKSRLADDALYLIGWVAFQQQDDAGAIVEFERLLQAYPDGDHAVRALYTIGDARFNLGEIDAAITTYRDVMARFPSHPLATEAARSLQDVLVGQGRTEEALVVLDTLIRANPQSLAAEEFSWKKAEIFYSGKQYQNAAGELQAYLRSYPSAQRSDEALYLLGKTYLTMNDLPQALEAFASISRRDAKSRYIVSSSMDLAEYYTRSANTTSADSIYRIIFVAPDADTTASSLAGYELAEHARMRQDSIGAMELYQQTADRFPASEYGAQSRYKLAQLHRRAGRLDSTRFHLNLLAQRTDAPLIVANVLYDLGTSFMRERNHAVAAGYFERVRDDHAGIEDWYTLSMLSLGECYEALDRKPDAISTYQTVLTIRPDDDYGKTAQARLKRLTGGRR